MGLTFFPRHHTMDKEGVKFMNIKDAKAPFENEFVNTFPGGLLYTCGLRSAGPANEDKTHV